MQPARLGASAWCFVTSALLALLALASSSRAQTVLETPQQTNDRIRSLSSSVPASTSHDYVIGRGDVLGVEVFDVPELTREVRVSQSGTIGLPLIPVRLRVAGLTEVQTQQKIAEVLEADGLVAHPDVIVSVKERRSKPITIVGAVAKPMVYQADHPVTLLEALAEAGGISSDAGDTVIVSRPVPDSFAGEDEPSAENPAAAPASAAAEPPPLNTTITVNLNELLENGDLKDNIPLQAGDVVSIPHAGIVYVLGAVGRPGGFVVSNDRMQLSALKVLALAGGMKGTAKSDKAVIIRRDSQGQQQEVPIDLKRVLDRKTEDVRLQPSDILFVPDNTAKAVLYKAAQIGLGVGTAVAIFRLANH